MRKFGLCLCAVIAVLTVLGAPVLAHAPPPDTTPPLIGTPAFTPSSPSSTDTVTVLVNVTDNRSGVNNVTIVYTTDNWHTVNATVLATYSATTTTATAQIPALHAGGRVSFYIVSLDNAGNKAVNNNSGNYFSYNVAAPPVSSTTSTWIVYGALGAVLAGVAIASLKTLRRRNHSTPQTGYSNR